MSRCPQRQEKGLGSPGVGVTDSCEPPMSLRSQWLLTALLLTAEPSLQHHPVLLPISK